MTPRRAEAPGPAPLGAQPAVLLRRSPVTPRHPILVEDERMTREVYLHAQESMFLSVGFAC